MTTVPLLRRPANHRARAASILLWAVVVGLVIGRQARSQDPPRHWLHVGVTPPGAIGSLRLLRNGPLSGHVQPVRIRVPSGTRIAPAVDGYFSTATEGDSLVGLLVGAVYRFQVSGLVNHPGIDVYPTIEVIDRTYPPPGLALKFPVPVDLTSEELALAAHGAFITRIIYVEDPLQALPIAQQEGRTPWVEARQGEDPLVVADRLGRPIAILRIGSRMPPCAGCDDRFTYGTPPIQIYDGSMVPPPGSPADHAGWPTVDATCDAACDPCAGDAYPVVGPPDEYLCDGGDFGLPVGIRADWTVEGLEQEDAVAHYDTIDGQVFVQPTNRVCIYAPRFAAVRRLENLRVDKRNLFVNVYHDDAAPVRAEDVAEPTPLVQRTAAVVDVGQRPPSLLRARQQAGELVNLKAVMDVKSTLAPYANLEVVRTGVLENNEKPWLASAIQSAITWTGDQAAQVLIDNLEAVALVGQEQPGVVYGLDGPDRPRLRICKLASTGNALPGQIVEFTIRFDNIGDQVIGNVTIVDNLSTRLEYVPESAKSSLDANFLTIPNDSGSDVLRWEIIDPLEPGKGGILQFQCRVL